MRKFCTVIFLNASHTFKEKFTQICQQIFEYGLQKHEDRAAEVAVFWECLNDAKAENKALAAAKINEFLAYKKKVRE